MRIEDGYILSGTYRIKLDKIYFFSVVKQYGLYRLTCNVDIVDVELGASQDKKLLLEGLNRCQHKLQEAGYNNFARVGNELFNMDKVQEMHYQPMGKDEHYVKIEFDKLEGFRHKKSKELADKLVQQFYSQYNPYIDSQAQQV